MKILLIDVPFGSEDIGGEDRSFAGVENVIPSLGLAYLAAAAEQAGHDVRILDCTVGGKGWDDVTAEGRTFAPDVVGMTATTPSFGNAVKTVELLRPILPGAAFVVGGSHPTAMPEHTAAAGVFDFLVAGEGEETFVELLGHLNGAGPALAEIRGLGWMREGKPVLNPLRAPIADLDNIPFPARHLLPPLSAYHPTPASLRKLPLVHVMTSRGCPFRCNFCDRAVFGDRCRQRSVNNVMQEVTQVVSVHGAREIRFFDDTFTLNRERLENICAEMKQFRPRLPWTCLTNVKCVDLDMLRMMKDAGCWQVLYGLESGDDGILKSLGKGNTVADNRQAVEWARKAGLRVRCDFLVGSPDETMDTLRRTVEFARSLDIDFAHFNKFVPFPGTRFYDELVLRGHTFDFSQSSTLDHDALVFVPPAIDPDEYREFLDRAYRQFYLRPGYLARRALGMRTFTEFWWNVKGAFSVGSL